MKRRQWLILGIGSLVVLVLLMFLFQRRDSDEGKSLSRRPAVSKPVREHTAPGPSVRVTPAPPQPVPVERGTGVAVVASSRMVEQRPVEFSNLVNVIWSAELGTVFAAEDAGSASVKVPAGMDVNTLQQALLRCAMSLLLWDEDVNQDTIKALKGYCETGGWLVFVSCPWIGSPPKSSPAELLGPRSFEGIAHVGAASQNRKAFALLKHPSLPELPVGERLRVYLQSSKALSGGEGRKIPLIRFEDPALRGVTIQAVGHGGVVELNWDCPAGGRIGETDSQDFLKTVLTWLSGKDTWKEPVDQPGISLKVIARTPAGDPAPGAQIVLKVHTDWAKPFDQQVVTTDENGEADTPAKAPAIYTAWAAGEGYSSDNLALGRVAERTVPEPLVVIVRPSLRIVGTAVYTGEKTGPASEVQVDLLPSSRARGMDVASAETDKEGRFIFDQVPGGRPYLLRCETEEWAALEEIDLPESAEAGAFEVTLSLKKLVAIDGRVVEEGEEQNPIEGATVHIEPYWGVKAVPLFLQRLRGKSALTGAQGEFSLPVLPDVTYQIKAEAPQYIWRERASEENPDRTGEGWLEVKPPATVTLDLYHGTTIGGLVYLPGGQPAAGAEVTLTRVRGSLYTKNWTQMADLGGRFSFPCTEVSLRSLEDRVKYVHLAASSGPYSAVDMVKVPAEERNVELILSLRESPLVVLQGIVTDTEEHPVANASLYGGSKSGKPICHSDENGFFEVRFPSVRYVGETPLPRELQVWKEGYEVVDVETSQLETAARDNNPLRVILPRSDGRIAGTIVFHDGAPLCNEVVDLLPTSGLMPGLGIGSKDAVVLGQRGEFALEGIRFQGRGSKLFEAPVKSIDLQVTWYPDRESRTLKVKASRKDIALGASDVVVRFDPTLELRGRMVDEEHGGPITDVSLELRSLYFVRSGRSDAAGEFRLRWMSPGEWHLKARCPGYFPWEKQIEVRLGAEDLGDIVLYRRLIVLGHAVSQSTGMPIEGAEVRVVATERMFGDSPSVSAVDCAWDTTDSAGRFSLRFNNPFNDIISDFLKASYAMSVIIKQGRARASREIDPSHVGPSGVIALGRIEL